jgi:mRNA-degrading endonuclease toxin of MazEF toxin-antitoxin module
MPVECVLTLDNTFSAEKTFLTRRVTELSPTKMTEICSALSAATHCG